MTPCAFFQLILNLLWASKPYLVSAPKVYSANMVRYMRCAGVRVVIRFIRWRNRWQNNKYFQTGTNGRCWLYSMWNASEPTGAEHKFIELGVYGCIFFSSEISQEQSRKVSVPTDFLIECFFFCLRFACVHLIVSILAIWQMHHMQRHTQRNVEREKLLCAADSETKNYL